MNEEKITTSANKKLSPEEIKRVKGLGCLQDKRYDDIFNIRVITGNGHITTDEHRAIADAADKFGNGQITMTTRLSMEIQGVPYANIEKINCLPWRTRPDDRRNRSQSASCCLMQGNNLPVWSD